MFNLCLIYVLSAITIYYEFVKLLNYLIFFIIMSFYHLFLQNKCSSENRQMICK